MHSTLLKDIINTLHSLLYELNRKKSPVTDLSIPFTPARMHYLFLLHNEAAFLHILCDQFNSGAPFDRLKSFIKALHVNIPSPSPDAMNDDDDDDVSLLLYPFMLLQCESFHTLKPPQPPTTRRYD